MKSRNSNRYLWMHVYSSFIHNSQKVEANQTSVNWCCCSVPKWCPTLQPLGLQHPRLACPSPSPTAHSNSCPLSQWCHPTISSSVVPFSCLQSFPALGSSHQVAKVLGLQLQHQSFQRIFRVDFLQDWLVWSPCCPRDSEESSPTPQFKSIKSLALSLLYGPTLTSIYDYWKNHSSDCMDRCWHSGISAF